MRQFGLIGYPLTHSFSPAFFTNKFKEEGIEDCSYNIFPIESIDQLPSLIESNPSLEGLNVTIPYKKDVLQYLHYKTEVVDEIGACNCIKIHNGKLYGYNTDVIGFEKPLIRHLKTHHNKALILGTGGAAVAVAYVLEKLGIEYLFVSRMNEGDNAISYDETASLISTHKLIINTTPLGMFPRVDEAPAIAYDKIDSSFYLFDLIYNPLETRFLKHGKEKGAAISNGMQMLIIQAEESWKIWNNLH